MELQKKGQKDLTIVFGAPKGGTFLVTPPIQEDYWVYRVPLSEKQAIVAFPKFGTIGIGFQQEEDWNTNLPYTCKAKEIYSHIAHNKGSKTITKKDCILAIEMIQEAIWKEKGEK